MPNISIGDESILHFDKLDNLYIKILVPFFKEVLNKRQLKTKLDLNIDNLYKLPPSNLFNYGEVVPINKIQQDEQYEVSFDGITNIGGKLYKQVQGEYNLPKGHTSGLNFIIDNDKLHENSFPKRR